MGILLRLAMHAPPMLHMAGAVRGLPAVNTGVTPSIA